MLSFWLKTLLPFSSTEKKRKEERMNKSNWFSESKKSPRKLQSASQSPVSNQFHRPIITSSWAGHQQALSRDLILSVLPQRTIWGKLLTFSTTDIRYCAVTVHPPFYCILCPLLATNRYNYFRYDIQFQINHRVKMHHMECCPWVVFSYTMTKWHLYSFNPILCFVNGY